MQSFTSISPIPLTYSSDVLHLYKQASWTNNRTLEDVVSILEGSTYTYGILDAHGTLVATARVLSDGRVKALIHDVIVDQNLQGARVGTQLLNSIIHDPHLTGQDIELYTWDAILPFYLKNGFSVPMSPPLQVLRLQPYKIVEREQLPRT